MSDHGYSVDTSPSRVGWFAAGALAVAVAIGLFLYADGYFERARGGVSLTVDMPAVIIEGG